jgi:large subunit ribosomal protein L30
LKILAEGTGAAMVTKKKVATIRIKYVQSAIGCPHKHKLVVRGLGLRKLQHVVERPDTPSIRGMVAKIPHLVRILD